MTEAQLLQAVRDLARLLGFLTYHTHRSDRSEPGFLDLVLIHPRIGRLAIAELKTEKGRVTPAQHVWIAAFRTAGVDAYIWRPSDLRSGLIYRALSGQPRRPTAEAPSPLVPR